MPEHRRHEEIDLAFTGGVMSEKDTIKFKTDPKTGGVEAINIGRFVLASGAIARLMLTPEGLRILVDYKECLENGDIITGPFSWGQTVFGLKKEGEE